MDPALARYIALRDGGCVARYVNSAFYASRWPMLQGLPDPGPCRDRWGNRVNPEAPGTYDHVKRELGMGIREDDPEQLWMLCAGHHGFTRLSPWATRADVREAARAYIAAANAAAREAGWPEYPVHAA